MKKKVETLGRPILEKDLATPFFGKLPKTSEKTSSPIVFAVESALLSWNKTSFPDNFEKLFPGTKESFSVRVNDLLYPEGSRFDLAASSFKIKIGRFSKMQMAQKEIAFIKKK